MIAADIKGTGWAAGLGLGVQKALAFLRRGDLLSLPAGRFDLDGEQVFAMVQRYVTEAAAAPRFECHRKYIDVQYIAAGIEAIGWAPLGRMTVTEAYDPDKDIAFGRVADGGWSPVVLGAGRLLVLYPADAHAPKLAAGAPSSVTKIVVKVAV